MASITGLTPEQCEQLAGAQVGDLILVVCDLKDDEREYSNDNSNGDSDNGSEGSEEEQEEMVANGDDSEESEVLANGEDGEEVAASEHNESEQNAEDESMDEDMANLESMILYKVHTVAKDNNDTVTDISLCSLTYCLKLAEVQPPIFHLYGTVLEHSDITSVASDALVSIKDIINNATHDNYLYVNCTGDDVRHTIFDDRCPAQCNNGWVSTQQGMHDMVGEDITMVTEHMPVCPVCVGKDLMQEYQALREILETTNGGMIDLGIVVEFHGRLNPRRRQLGYPFKQFDEREWGYLFDDVNSDDDRSQDGHGGNTDGWGYWPEALDPSSCIVHSPASDATIAELPRKTFAEVKKADEDAECLVCKEKFTDDVVVAELPCGHFFCNEGCIEQWLKQFNNCPTCRGRLPPKDDEPKGEKMNGIVDSVIDGDNNHVEDGDADEDAANEMEASADGVEKDGEDSVMSEPVDAVSEW